MLVYVAVFLALSTTIVSAADDPITTADEGQAAIEAMVNDPAYQNQENRGQMLENLKTRFRLATAKGREILHQLKQHCQNSAANALPVAAVAAAAAAATVVSLMATQEVFSAVCEVVHQMILGNGHNHTTGGH